MQDHRLQCSDSISRKWVQPSHFCKYFIISFHVTTLKKWQLKLSCSTVAKIIQQFNRRGSTQNRPRHGGPKKLSARAQRHIQRLWLVNRHMSAASIAAEVEGVGVQPTVLRPYAAHCIKLVCMAVVPEGSLFKRRCTRKPANSLLKTSRLRTWITGTMSCGLMRLR